MKLYSFLGAVKKGYHPLSPTTGDNHISIKPNEPKLCLPKREKTPRDRQLFQHLYRIKCFFV